MGNSNQNKHSTALTMVLMSEKPLSFKGLSFESCGFRGSPNCSKLQFHHVWNRHNSPTCPLVTTVSKVRGIRLLVHVLGLRKQPGPAFSFLSIPACIQNVEMFVGFAEMGWISILLFQTRTLWQESWMAALWWHSWVSDPRFSYVFIIWKYFSAIPQ